MKKLSRFKRKNTIKHIFFFFLFRTRSNIVNNNIIIDTIMKYNVGNIFTILRNIINIIVIIESIIFIIFFFLLFSLSASATAICALFSAYSSIISCM